MSENEKTIELTEENKALLEKRRAEWLENASNSSPINKEATEEVINEFYDMMKFDRPLFFYGKSPSECNALIDYLTENHIEEFDRDEFEKFRKTYTSKNFHYPAVGGQQSTYWIAFYTYCEEIGVEYQEEDSKKLDMWARLNKNIFWWYPFEGACIVCEKPSEIHWDDENSRLHNENGPAILFKDGDKVYCLNGVRVPDWLVETPEDELDPEEFAKLKNVEVRREFVRKIGMEKLIQKLNHEIVDESYPEDPHEYELVKVNLGSGEDNEDVEGLYLKMKNPSTGDYHFECVHPNCATVKEALRWRNGELDFDGNDVFDAEENVELT